MITWVTSPDKKGNWHKIDVSEEFFDNSKELSATDKSHYRPDAPAFARVQGASRVGLYDFTDGVDTGLDLSPLRRRGIDETEIQSCIERLKNLSNEQLTELKERAAETVLEASKKMEKENMSKQADSSSVNSASE